ncbi:uncharacterized protein LOC130720780 [Lotus japonicus]|uniref:uncharacterized protein LOC130720780 n=1 Tax=Lotus japonicus TaxID=34305 RepID=UPI00258307C2|nr:uncharacterized protein LOC130720780 [Lotus japonicus]
METLVVVEQHRNQCYSRSKPQGHAQFGSSPSRDFIGFNCRNFQKSHGSPKTPPHVNDNKIYGKKTTTKSSPIPINDKACRKDTTLSFSEDVTGGNGSFLLSELWAGPTYSNSPPPSSLPIPKFSVQPKRTVSLNLPGSSPEVEVSPVAKSAPPSPGREHVPSTRGFFVNADSATETLCRILNLNIIDE